MAIDSFAEKNVKGIPPDHAAADSREFENGMITPWVTHTLFMCVEHKLLLFQTDLFVPFSKGTRSEIFSITFPTRYKALTSFDTWRYFFPEVSINHWAALMPFSFLVRPANSPFSKGLFFKCVWCLDQTFACSSLVRCSFKNWAWSSEVPPWLAAAWTFSSNDIFPNFSKLVLFRSFLALAAFPKAAFLELLAFAFAFALGFFKTPLGFPKPWFFSLLSWLS